MKEYVHQFYNEGFATTFYLKPINFIKKHIKNKAVLKVLTLIIQVIYTILMIIIGVITFIKQYPL